MKTLKKLSIAFLCMTTTAVYADNLTTLGNGNWSDGATWDAGEKIIGLDVDTAIEKIGLEAQFCCTANPADWDPINGKSPVHLAADFHSNALAKAVKECCVENLKLQALT